MTDTSAFTKFVPGFEFLQGLVKNAGAALPGLGQWVAPTLNPEELEKKIDELRTVQFWLEQNARLLGATIQAATGLPTLVHNDADAALHGEYTFGTGSDDMILVRVGRGVGSSIMVGGIRASGVHHAAGEIGHVTVGTDGGATCQCGRTGCLETWLAVPALETALAAAAQSPDPEAAAHAVLRTAGERLAISLAPIVAAIDVAEVVLCGPAALLDGTLIESVRETLAQRVLPLPTPNNCSTRG